MKQIVIAGCVFIMLLASCSKKQNNIETTLPSDIACYYKGQRVYSSEEITQGSLTEKVALLTDQRNGIPAYYFFDNMQEAAAFTANDNTLQVVHQHINRYIAMRAYAVQLNEDAYVSTHHCNSDLFTQYVQQINPKKRLIQGTVFVGLNYTGLFVDKFAGTNIFPVMPPGTDNAVKSVKFAGPGVNPYTLCDFANGAAPFLIVNANNAALLPVYRNRTTSIF